MVQQQNKFGHWLKTSITARMLIVGALVLVLLIPLTYVNVLISERSHRQRDVITEINTKWGSEVLLYGPILKLPYTTYTETQVYIEKSKSYKTEREAVQNYVYIFPEELNVTSNVKSKTQHLGNFETAVFTSDLKLNGSFALPDLEKKGITSASIDWEKATFILKTTNLKGIKTEMEIAVGENSLPFETKFSNHQNRAYRMDELETSFMDSEVLKEPFNFNMNMTYDGSEKLQIVPVGKTTTLSMTSNWADPGFIGGYAPNDETKSITPEGFSADWKVLSINRPFSQTYTNNIPNLDEYAFGTKFVVLVDDYQKSERSAKYGFLVIGLTFLVFFLIQTLSKISIHPFQYLMIGLALIMFYTLLVSISEHSSFLKAYLIAGVSVVTLITLYSKSILKSFRFTAFIGLSLTVLYSFVYVIIQLENYALLVGSVGLFLILASVMYVSRKIDWNNH
ncbi:cell envelope integrity protein CreD [Winogradskyella maritima]|uniref:Cell envelope integrity protein CreD n=1 Tax=Winogradskyella maritima TaxID=1517766 RepID=A0ABV8AI60_9FLAO|nr:cell envelope integrity protein CreD [Winogradskyella maritima]